MNSYELETSLEHIFCMFDSDSYEVKIIKAVELYSLKITKPRTFLVVFVQGHPSDNKQGHFVVFTVKNQGRFIDTFEFFDTFSRSPEFYFKDLPFETDCLAHPEYQEDSSKDCALICLYYILQRQHAPYDVVIQHFNELLKFKRVHIKCSDYYKNISYNLELDESEYTKPIYYPREKKLVLEFLEKKNGQ